MNLLIKNGHKSFVIDFRPVLFLLTILVQSQIMFDNRKERLELLQELVVSDKDFIVPRFSQVRIGLIETIITDFIYIYSIVLLQQFGIAVFFLDIFLKYIYHEKIIN